MVAVSFWCFLYAIFSSFDEILIKLFLRLVERNAEEGGGIEDLAKDDEVPLVPPHSVLLRLGGNTTIFRVGPLVPLISSLVKRLTKTLFT